MIYSRTIAELSSHLAHNLRQKWGESFAIISRYFVEFIHRNHAEQEHGFKHLLCPVIVKFSLKFLLGDFVRHGIRYLKILNLFYFHCDSSSPGNGGNVPSAYMRKDRLNRTPLKAKK